MRRLLAVLLIGAAMAGCGSSSHHGPSAKLPTPSVWVSCAPGRTAALALKAYLAGRTVPCPASVRPRVLKEKGVSADCNLGFLSIKHGPDPFLLSVISANGRASQFCDNLGISPNETLWESLRVKLFEFSRAYGRWWQVQNVAVVLDCNNEGPLDVSCAGGGSKQWIHVAAPAICDQSTWRSYYEQVLSIIEAPTDSLTNGWTFVHHEQNYTSPYNDGRLDCLVLPG